MMLLPRCPHCREIIWESNTGIHAVWQELRELDKATSRIISGRLEISVQNAHNQLKRLEANQLAVSEMRAHPSGGRERIWEALADNPNKILPKPI